MTNEDSVPFIAHESFRQGVSGGRFRIVINPALATPYVVQRTRVDWIAMALILVGAAMALAGQGAIGLVLVALGVTANRLVRHQAAKIVLQLAISNPTVYSEVTSNGVMEVTQSV